MNLFQLVLKQMRQRSLSTWLTLLSVLLGVSLAIAAVVLTPFAAVDHPTATPSLKAWGALIALGLFCTAAAFVFYGILVGEVGAGRALVITYVNPVVAVALGVAILGERPGAGAIAGLLLILAGSWLSTDGRLPPGLVALLERFDSRASPPDIGSVRELTAP